MKPLKTLTCLFVQIMILISFFGLRAQETSVMVRAKAKDAKFIGTSMGGAKIIVRNAMTGEIMVQGTTKGSTGNTQKIISEPQKRYGTITNETTAGFVAKLDITKPTFVTIEALAPMNREQAKVKATTQLWVIPGKDILGDGIILEIPGFVVDIISPQIHESIDATNNIEIKARMVMMCGCPISAGGLWNAEQYEIMAVIKSGGKTIREIPLQAEKPSFFTGKTNLKPDSYELVVYAFDPITGNTGVDKTNFHVK